METAQSTAQKGWHYFSPNECCFDILMLRSLLEEPQSLPQCTHWFRVPEAVGNTPHLLLLMAFQTCCFITRCLILSLIRNLDSVDEENDTHRHLCLCSLLPSHWHQGPSLALGKAHSLCDITNKHRQTLSHQGSASLDVISSYHTRRLRLTETLVLSIQWTKTSDISSWKLSAEIWITPCKTWPSLSGFGAHLPADF